VKKKKKSYSAVGLPIEGISQSKQECHSTAMRNQINSRATIRYQYTP
jgi:hypothetical protein